MVIRNKKIQSIIIDTIVKLNPIIVKQLSK